MRNILSSFLTAHPPLAICLNVSLSPLHSSPPNDLSAVTSSALNGWGSDGDLDLVLFVCSKMVAPSLMLCGLNSGLGVLVHVLLCLHLPHLLPPPRRSLMTLS